MKIIITESQYRKIFRDDKDQKIFKIPGLEFFHEDPFEAWQILQKVLEHRGNPPYTIGGDLYLVGTPIETLGNLISVGGYLNLNNTPIESLGNLTSVGGYLDLRNTPIESLGKLTSVGDDLYLEDTTLSINYTKKQIRKMVDVSGKIYL